MRRVVVTGMGIWSCIGRNKEEVDGKYKWTYDEEDLYCLKDDSFAKYDTKCGKFEKIKMDNKWCESYKTSTLVYEDNIEKYCEE